jgi:type II secretory pathway component PulF
MPIFEYTGTDRYGTALRASVEADSIKTAKQKIKKTGVVLLSSPRANLLRSLKPIFRW